MRMRQVEERYTPQELREYEACKIAYRDIKNSVDNAKLEGIAEGLVKKSLHPALAQDKGAPCTYSRWMPAYMPMPWLWWTT